MNIESWYNEHYEFHLKGRYITLESIFPLLDMYKMNWEISVPAVSELGKDIPLIKVGQGRKKVLAWSQMHGNESTTTKAIFDFLKFVNQKRHFQKEINSFLENYSLYIIPILNPDGAQLYTRENANGVDLNRDAQELSQKESICLRNIFKTVNPSLCLNLHDQRSIYGLENGKSATLSFLAPAADEERSVTESRKVAMESIVKINKIMQNYLPNQIGRYDDTFNDACVGDTFQQMEVPTILFEAGHFKNDYLREKTREFVFYSLLALFGIIGNNEVIDFKEYFEIPQNKKNYKDFILRNIKLPETGESQDLAIQYKEELRAEKIEFVPIIDYIGNLQSYFAHNEENADSSEILVDSQENFNVGKQISKIVDKYDKSLIYFQ